MERQGHSSAGWLTNISHADPVPHLYSPCTSAPAAHAASSAAETAQLLQQPRDPAVVAEMLTLLQAVDIGYLQPKVQQSTPPACTSVLQQQLEQLDGKILLCTFTAQTREPVNPSVSQVIKPKPTFGASSPLSSLQTQRSIPGEESDHKPIVVRLRPKKRSAQEAFGPPVSKEQLGAVCSEQLMKFQQLHQRLAARYDEHEPSLLQAAGQTAQISVQLSHLQELCEAVVKAHAAQAIAAVETGVLTASLATLEPYVRLGIGKLLPEDGDLESHSCTSILKSLEAAALCLYIMTSPNLPKQAYPENIIDAIISLLKFHLINHAYAYHDARLRQTYRPGWEIQEPGIIGGKRKHQSREKTTSLFNSQQDVLALIEGRLETLLQLVGDLLSYIKLQSSSMMPLLRVAGQALTVEGVDMLQVKATGLVVAGFRHFSNQRKAILEEICSNVLPLIPTGRRLHRAFVMDSANAGAPAIQMISALVLQLVQVSVDLPSMDTDVQTMRNCFKPAAHWSTMFFNACLDKVSNARTIKSDTEADFKNLMEQIFSDILAVLHLPEWPAAATLLLCGVVALGRKGLQSSEASMRQSSVDLLGLIATSLTREALAYENEACEVSHLLGQGHSLAQAQKPVMAHLAQAHHAELVTTGAALRFMLCRAFAEQLSDAQQEQDSTERNLTSVLVHYYDLAAEVARPGQPEVSRAATVRLARTVVQQGPLARVCSTLLKWLLDLTDASKELPTTRAKAVKALATVVEADPRLLGIADVQAGVHRALQDEAVSVREAAVDLLGKHIGGSRELAEAYFEILAVASRDTGTSVRKRAVKILWEACIRVPGFSRATDACVAVLQRAADAEESIQDLVGRTFYSLWFEGDAGGTNAPSRTADRAKQLADVAAAVYEAGGKAIHLPLEPGHPLVTVIQQALEQEHNDGLAKHPVSMGIAAALLEHVLQAEEGRGGCQAFPALMALHAFCVADASLCMPPDDPLGFARCLAPYLKVTHEGTADQTAQRRSAEQLMCIIAVVEQVMARCGKVDSSLMPELEFDLYTLISKHAFVQVVSAACQAFCSLAKVSQCAAQKVVAMVSEYCKKLKVLHKEFCSELHLGPEGQSSRALASRFLFVLGQLCRHGIDIIEVHSSAEEGSGQMSPTASAESVSLKNCLRVFLAHFQSGKGGAKTQETALQGLGALFVAKPSAMLDPAARQIMKAVLQPCAPTQWKMRALTNLTDLLKTEDARLVENQKGVRDEQSAKNVKRLKRRAKAAPLLPTENGTADSLSVSSGILQDNWELVLQLATDTTRMQASSPPSAAANAIVRRQCLDLIEVVLQGGLVAPWTAVPPLVVLCCDPNKEVAGKALRLLTREANKHVDFFFGRLAEGLVQADAFHRRLALSFPDSTPPGTGVPAEIVEGISMLYASLVQPIKSIRVNFLQTLLKRFDQACNLAAPCSGQSELRLLLLIAQVVAALPFKRADEPCFVVHSINSIIARYADGLLAGLQASLGKRPVDANNAVADATPPSGAAADAARQNGGAVGETARVPLSPPSRAMSVASIADQIKASLAASMLLILKQYIKASYSITSERIVEFANAERRKLEERAPTSRVAGVHLHLDKLDLDAGTAHEDKQLAKYKVFKALMKADAADYGDGIPAASHSKRKAGQMGGGGEPAMGLDHSEHGEAAEDWCRGMVGPTDGKRGGDRSGRFTKGCGSGRGRGRGAKVKVTGKRKRAASKIPAGREADSWSQEEASDADWSAGTAKRRLEPGVD